MSKNLEYSEMREKVAFAIYKRFIRGGVGSCIPRMQGDKYVMETPDEARSRRWHFALPCVKDSFRKEADAAMKAIQSV